MKDKYGNFAYVAEGLKFAKNPPEANYKATVDGQVIEERGCFATSLTPGPPVGSHYRIADVDPSDGLLDLYLITPKVRPIRAVSHYVLKVGDFQAGIYRWQGREISCKADPAQNVWMDGEEYGKTRVTPRFCLRRSKWLCPNFRSRTRFSVSVFA